MSQSSTQKQCQGDVVKSLGISSNIWNARFSDSCAVKTIGSTGYSLRTVSILIDGSPNEIGFRLIVPTTVPNVSSIVDVIYNPERFPKIIKTGVRPNTYQTSLPISASSTIRALSNSILQIEVTVYPLPPSPLVSNYKYLFNVTRSNEPDDVKVLSVVIIISTIEQVANTGSTESSTVASENILSSSQNFPDVLRSDLKPPKCNTLDPLIYISSLTSGQGQNYGESLYTVYDIKPYSGTITCESQVVNINNSKYYRSQFSEFPQINCLLVGKGCTLYQKFQSIITCYGFTITVDQFAAKMALYALSKYILARLLYGKFSLQYLTRSFNDEFMADLHNSRFRKFEIIFVDPAFGLVGFDRFFRDHC